MILSNDFFFLHFINIWFFVLFCFFFGACDIQGTFSLIVEAWHDATPSNTSADDAGVLKSNAAGKCE